MKDSYTLRPRRRGPARARYELHIEAYDRIFDRCRARVVPGGVRRGHDGRLGAHEYMAPCPAGENESRCGVGLRGKRRGRAAPSRSPVRGPAGGAAERSTRRARRRSMRSSSRLGAPAGGADQGFPDRGGEPRPGLVVARGDHRVNEIKLSNALGQDFCPAHGTRLRAHRSCPASLVRSAPTCAVLLRRRVHGRRSSRAQRGRACTSRASSPAATSLPRAPTCAPSRRATPPRPRDPDRAGDRGRQHLQARHALSEPLGATYLDEAAAAADLDGVVRHRPGPHRRRGRRAVRR